MTMIFTAHFNQHSDINNESLQPVENFYFSSLTLNGAQVEL